MSANTVFIEHQTHSTDSFSQNVSQCFFRPYMRFVHRHTICLKCYSYYAWIVLFRCKTWKWCKTPRRGNCFKSSSTTMGQWRKENCASERSSTRSERKSMDWTGIRYKFRKNGIVFATGDESTKYDDKIEVLDWLACNVSADAHLRTGKSTNPQIQLQPVKPTRSVWTLPQSKQGFHVTENNKH